MGVCNGQTDFALTLTIWPEKERYGCHTFVLFCELVEGEENKLTTFSTWTIVLGCNESNIIFQQHLCKLGQLRRSNGRNSQVLGQAMKKRPTAHYKKYSHIKGRDTAPTTSSREGSCIFGRETVAVPGRRGAARAAHAQFYHRGGRQDHVCAIFADSAR